MKTATLFDNTQYTYANYLSHCTDEGIEPQDEKSDEYLDWRKGELDEDWDSARIILGHLLERDSGVAFGTIAAAKGRFDTSFFVNSFNDLLPYLKRCRETMIWIDDDKGLCVRTLNKYGTSELRIGKVGTEAWKSLFGGLFSNNPPSPMQIFGVSEKFTEDDLKLTHNWV